MSSPPHDAQRPARARRVLDNGLTVVAMERRHLPILSATLLLPIGTAIEPEDLPGVAFFASQVLPMGTSAHSAVELAEKVDALGATLGSGCGHDFTTIEVTGLAHNGETLLDILAEVTLTPAFLAEEVERRRSQILGLLERKKDDYGDAVHNRFGELIYGTHPYHRRREGRPESVAAITREDLVALHERHYSPRGAILALVGDLDPEKAFQWVEERFGEWESRESDTARSEEIPAVTERKVLTVQEEVTQAYIRVGNIGIERAHPDYAATAVMNYILGAAGFGSRLMKRLREERGLTYGVHSSFWLRKQPGYFFAGTQTGIETMNEALALMLAEIERFLDGGVTEDELVWAKKYLTGSLPLTLETNEQLAHKLLEQEFFGLRDFFWLEDLKRMQAVTATEIREVARRHIHPERFAIVVLADFREHSLEVPGGGS